MGGRKTSDCKRIVSKRCTSSAVAHDAARLAE
ncbi:hypothetical protein BSFP_054530 [Burkholderia stabilis]|uniref:Uncharacterized protein n=1 Tax=Burkholderia stabilis TaxID=95485 RepID=A0A1Y1BS14_9BURK|nr:hypothetical protein BSFP_054530 [Burkholderia stabilis]